MSNWKETTINIGYVKQKSNRILKFESNSPVLVQHVSPSCTSCTKFIDYKDNILTLRYEAPEFPKHLVNERFAPIQKYVTVYYEDGTREQLNFNGFLTK